MSNAMYDAREALIPGSVYDRSSNGEETLLLFPLTIYLILLNLFPMCHMAVNKPGPLALLLFTAIMFDLLTKMALEQQN